MKERIRLLFNDDQAILKINLNMVDRLNGMVTDDFNNGVEGGTY